MHPAVRKLRHRFLQIVAPHRLTWEENFRPSWAVSGSGTVQAGPKTYWRSDSRFTAWKASDSITIGAYCSIASGATLLAGGNHDVDALSTYPFSVITGSGEAESRHQPSQHLTIGNDVWIAAGALVVGDITVGDGAVIGAGAVVIDDVPSYSVVVGVPARVVRQRFSADDIEQLEQLQWWTWPDADVLGAEPLLRGGDVKALAAYADVRRLPVDPAAAPAIAGAPAAEQPKFEPVA